MCRSDLRVDKQHLKLEFKGDRTYLQGGDIFNAIDRIARKSDLASYPSHLVFRHFAKHDCDLLWDRPESSAVLVAQGSVCFADSKRLFWVTESSRPVTGRNEYDEESIVNPAVSEGKQIVLEKRSIYTPIEEIIALTKRLSYKLTPDIDGKWVFGQLNLHCALPNEYGKLRIERKSEVPGRFSLSKIDIEDSHVGDIRFIVGMP
jgi:hypothetical protein